MSRFLLGLACAPLFRFMVMLKLGTKGQRLTKRWLKALTSLMVMRRGLVSLEC